MVLEDPCIINNLLHSIGYRSKIQRFEDLLPLITVTMLKMSIDYYEDCFGRARKVFSVMHGFRAIYVVSRFELDLFYVD